MRFSISEKFSIHILTSFDMAVPIFCLQCKDTAPFCQLLTQDKNIIYLHNNSMEMY